MEQDARRIVEIPPRLERLFLHFFDTHFLEDKGRAVETKNFRDEVRLATRLAVASADRVLVPAASYFESPICRETVDDLGDLVKHGLIMLVGSSTNLEEFVRERQDERFYRKGSTQHDSYQRANLKLSPAYHRRHRSATRDIVDRWTRRVESEDLQRLLRDAAGAPIPHIETRLERVPEELGGLAFIPEHVYEVLELGDGAPVERARIRSVINEAYFDSYVRELGAGVVDDLSYLASDFKVPSYGRNLSYLRMLRFLMASKLMRTVADGDPLQLVALGNDPVWREALTASVSHVGSKEPRIGGGRFVMSNQKNDQSNSQPPEHSVLCVATASIEFATVRYRLDQLFGKGKIVPLGSDFVVEHVDPTTGTRWTTATLPFQGQVEAATRVAHLGTALNPTHTLMVGMCMGMPKRGYPAGTVIVPNEVFSFDHQRLTQKGAQHRPHGERVTNGLYTLARLVSSEVHDYKVVADKGLASASTKIEDPQADLVALIESCFPDVAAFDMEGGGFYRAAHGRECLWIKAVADSGEPQEPSSAGQDKKHETQADVTGNAIDFAVRLVRQYYASNGAGAGS